MGLARSTFYADRQSQPVGEAHILEQIFQIKAEFPFYGYRRVTAALRLAGLIVNRKRVLRQMDQIAT